MAGRPTVGVLVMQLGTPDAPTPAAVRRYLREFLSDRRVIDLPRALWLPVLHLIVLRTRPRASAALYKKVWTPEGSPLLVITNRQAALLQARLSAAGESVRVVTAMRYGEPSIASAVSTLMADGIDRWLAFSMYPQYAGPTTGSSLDRLFEIARTMRVVPSIRVVPPYYADPLYIDALATVARESVASLPEPPERCLLSFHGLPKRFTTEGDPYQAHCEASARLLAEALGWLGASIETTFQSRFGREEWLQPYTDKVLEEAGRAGARVAVMSPGFTADCLETLEEIGLRGAEQFHAAGGRTFHRIPCLNEHPAWIDAMAAIVRRELAGWSPNGPGESSR
jgi:protoporphyrin/coproporphyrin ferrochelatase